MTVEFLIRPATEADAQAIIEVLNPIIEAGRYTIMDAPLSVDEQIEFMRGFPTRGVFHVAVGAADQRLWGLQSVEPVSASTKALWHVGEISTFVALGAHRLGVGRHLSAATVAGATARGFRKFTATVRGDNPPAVAFYQSQGFQIIGTARQHAFIQGRYMDEVLMERFLD